MRLSFFVSSELGGTFCSLLQPWGGEFKCVGRRSSPIWINQVR